jgi:hypothetical protein
LGHYDGELPLSHASAEISQAFIARHSMVLPLLFSLLTTGAASTYGKGGNQVMAWDSAFLIFALLAVAGFAAAASSGHEGGSDKKG